MTYTIISDARVNGKTQGEKLTDKELQAAGADIAALIASGHIQSDEVTQTTPAPEGASE